MTGNRMALLGVGRKNMMGGDLGASLGAGQHGDRRAAPRTALVLCHFHFWNKFSTKVDFDL